MTNTTDNTANTTTNTEDNTMTNTTTADTKHIVTINVFNRSFIFNLFTHEDKRAMAFIYVDADGTSHTKAITYERIGEAMDWVVDMCIKAYDMTMDMVKKVIEYFKEKFSKKEEKKENK